MNPFRRYPELRTVIVHTRSDKSFRGVLWQKRGNYLVLRGAKMLRAREEPIALDGEIVIAAGNVDYLQVV